MTELLIKAGAGVLAAMALLAALYFAEQHIEQRGSDRQLLVDQVKADKIKTDAAAILAAQTAKTHENETRLSDLIAKTETDRETSQIKNRADLRSHSDGPRLQFTAQAGGSGPSGGGAQSSAPGATGDPSPTVVQLPEPLNSNLWQLVGDAQSLSIDYGVLYNFLHNPKLVCELQE